MEISDVKNDTSCDDFISNDMNSVYICQNTAETIIHSEKNKTQHETEIQDLNNEAKMFSDVGDSSYLTKIKKMPENSKINLLNCGEFKFTNSNNKSGLNVNSPAKEFENVYVDSECGDEIIVPDINLDFPITDCVSTCDNVKIENINLQQNVTSVDINNILAGIVLNLRLFLFVVVAATIGW